MKYTIDTERRLVAIEDGKEKRREIELYSSEALRMITNLWVTCGWAARDSYQSTWLGQPIIQLPHDVLRFQELIWKLRPDVILETGVAHGGSVLLSASLCKLIGKGRVIGVDIEIRPRNRTAIETHSLGGLITLIEGSSIEPKVVKQVHSRISEAETVLVVLDSSHTKVHVAAELEAYSPLVSEGSYIVVADGIMRNLAEVPGGSPDWTWDNPCAAVEEFLAAHREFRMEEPRPVFDESLDGSWPTYWPGGYLRRLPN